MAEVDSVKVFTELKARVEKEKGEIDPIYFQLAEKILFSDKNHIPWILSKLANPEQARLLMALPDPNLKSPGGKSLEVSDELAAQLNMDKALIHKHLAELFEKGLVFPTKKGPAMARNFIQLHDAALGNPKYDEALGKAYFDLWGVIEGPMRKPLPQDMHEGKSEFRVIPRWKSIQDVPGVKPFEDTRGILRSQEFIALMHCGCKRSHTDRQCNVPDESCITLGRTAQYNIERNAGRRITYEEALEVLEKFDKHPTVNLTVNQREVNQLVCNCHYCCCLAIKIAGKSRFEPEINPQKCRGCKVCVSRCQFDAISLKYDAESGRERSYTDTDICRGCGCCVISCKAGARSMKLVRPEDYVPESLSIY